MAGAMDLFRLFVAVSCLFCWSEATITSLTSTSNNETTTETQEGCTVELTCNGIGDTSPIWRVFGIRDALQTQGNIRVISQVPLSQGPVTSMLIFQPISLTDAGAYTCTIGQTTRTIRLTVNGAVTLTPGNFEYDISDHDVGGSLPVLCIVQTCLPEVTVAVRKGTTVLKEAMETQETRNQFNLPVSNDLQGEHHCHATYSVGQQPGMVSSMTFNITGTPNVPTTAPPRNTRNGAPGVVSPILSFLIFAVTIFVALLH